MKPMLNPTVVTRRIRDNFDHDFLVAYARMVIAFGRLEAMVKLAIKNLAVSLKISADFAAGIVEAEKRESFHKMCKHLLALHEQKYGDCADGAELARWVEHANQIARKVRNRIVHGSLTIDDDGKPLLMFSRLDRKARAIEFHELTLSTAGLNKTHDKIVSLYLGLNNARRPWAE